MNIGEKDRPVYFGMNAWVEYCTLRGITITQMGEELQRVSEGGTGAEIRDLIWSALKCGALKNQQEFEYTNYDVGFWMDDIEQDELTNFFIELNKSMVSKLPSSNSKPVKKKQTA